MLRKRKGEDGAKSDEGWIRRRVLKSDEQEGKKRGEREKFDYSRWADYYCAAGRAEEGTGGQRRERKHLSEKKTTSLLYPPSVISPERKTGAVAGRGFACG